MANSILSNNPTQLLTKAKVNVSDWVSFTPVLECTVTNPNLGTPAVNSARWRRVGDSMEIEWDYEDGTGGANGAGAFLFKLPPGYVISNTITFSGLTDYSAQSNVLGTLYMLGPIGGGLGSGGIGQVMAYDNTSLQAFVNYGTQNDADGRYYPWDAETFNITFDRSVSIRARVPIQGWSSEAEFLAPLVQPKTAFIKDVKPAGTNGGNGQAASFITRDLNTLEGDTSFLSLSNNQVTLKPGDYLIEAYSPSRGTDGTQLFWRNVTDSEFTVSGMSHSAENNVYHNQVIFPLQGAFSITEEKTFELQIYTSSFNVTGTTTLGSTSTSGQPDVYSIVKLTKVL